MRRLSLTAGLATLACAAGLLVGALRVAQDSNPHHLPDDVLQFWRDYQLAKDADVTVLLYVKKTVKKNYAFGKGEMTDKNVDEVVDAVKEILPEKK